MESPNGSLIDLLHAFLGKVIDMSEKTAAADQAVKFSRKCSECGLRNFIDANVCRRCEADLSRRSTGAKKIKPAQDDVGGTRQSKSSGLILAGALAILFVLVLFYARHDPHGAEAVPGEADVSQSATQSQQPVQDIAIKDPQSQEPAQQVLAGLKRFQGTPKSSMSYEEYDEMLSRLKTDLNSTLPTFVRHDPSDERFRQEVAAALRDYTAAGSWWKTTIRNSKVLNDADRMARLQLEWGSAQTHLDNAEKLLQP